MLLSSSNRKYRWLPLISYFVPWLCAWDVCYIIFCHLLRVHSGKKQDFVSIVIVQLMMNANTRKHFGLQIVLVCLYITQSHYHHCANLPEDIELKKCPSDTYFVECVSKINHILSAIRYTICGAVCFQLTHFPCLWWLRACIYFVLLSSSDRKYQPLSIV